MMDKAIKTLVAKNVMEFLSFWTGHVHSMTSDIRYSRDRLKQLYGSTEFMSFGPILKTGCSILLVSPPFFRITEEKIKMMLASCMLFQIH